MSQPHIDNIISVKRELIMNMSSDDDDDNSDVVDNGDVVDYQTSNGRRVLRSRYLAVKNMIHGGNSILFNAHSVF
jgi:hypothetical protein